MLPVYKVFSLVIRVFARPVIARTKQIHMQQANKGKASMTKKFFVRLGGWYHRQMQALDSKIMGVTTNDFFYKPLNDEVALEKGVEFFYEIIIYGLLLGLPLYELYRSTTEAAAKSKASADKMSALEAHIETLKGSLVQESDSLKQQIAINEDLHNHMRSFADQINRQFHKLEQNGELLNTEISEMREQFAHIQVQFQNLIPKAE